jgi:hypothetical protein
MTGPHIVFTDRRQQRQPNDNTATYCVYWRKKTIINPIIVVLWLGCRCCRPSVNTICGRIMIGLSLSSASKHYVVVLWLSCRCCRLSVKIQLLCLLTDDNNDNPMIIRPHIVFTEGRQRQPNNNTTTYYVYWRTTTATTQFGLSLSSASKHYVVVLWLSCRCCRLSVNIQCGHIMIGFIVVVVRQ